MFYTYLKQPVLNSDLYTICQIYAETEEELSAKKEVYFDDGWVEAAEPEYHAQFANRTAPIGSAADKALGDEKHDEVVEEKTEEVKKSEVEAVETAEVLVEPEA